MNETMSLLLATAILAAGGLGLFMYKSSDENSVSDDYDEEILFSDENLENDSEDFDDEFIDYEPKPTRPRSRGGNKTKRSRKSNGSRRR